MSVVEDTRQVLQDFLAPQIREIATRLDALESRFTAAEARQEADKQEILRTLAADKQDILRAIAQLADITSMKERLARLETGAARP